MGVVYKAEDARLVDEGLRRVAERERAAEEQRRRNAEHARQTAEDFRENGDSPLRAERCAAATATQVAIADPKKVSADLGGTPPSVDKKSAG